jgi:hypothetical protein
LNGLHRFLFYENLQVIILPLKSGEINEMKTGLDGVRTASNPVIWVLVLSQESVFPQYGQCVQSAWMARPQLEQVLLSSTGAGAATGIGAPIGAAGTTL